MIRSTGAAVLALLVYLCASAALTWPVVLHPHTLLFGDFGDTRGWAWWLWAKSHGFMNGSVDPMLAAPFGIPNIGTVTHPISEGAAVLLTRFVGEIAAINVMVVLSFALTAWVTYFVLVRLIDDRGAAFFGGLVFGFCPAAVMQAAGGHDLYAFNIFIPLFVLALLHNRAARSARSALLVASSFAGVVLTAIYMGYFALLMAAYFVAYDFALSKSGGVRRIASNYALAAFFALLLLLPFEYGAIREQLVSSSASIARAGHMRGFDELSIYSAQPWSYLLPSIDHPVVGGAFSQYVWLHLKGSNVFEQTLYLGVIPLSLLACGFVVAARGAFDRAHRGLFLFFASAAFVAYLFSLPPFLDGGVPNISYFAYHIAPMFRAYARLGIFVAFFVSCAGAVVLTWIGRRLPPTRYYALVVILGLALAFEYWSVPPHLAGRVDNAPEVYRWLAKQPGDFVVAEYPMVRFDESAFYTYPFWQRVHHKRLVNGAAPDNPLAWELYQRVADPSTAEAAMALRSLGVKYVIVHKRMYEEGPIPAPLKRYYSPAQADAKFGVGTPAIAQQLRLRADFGSDLVFTFGD